MQKGLNLNLDKKNKWSLLRNFDFNTVFEFLDKGKLCSPEHINLRVEPCCRCGSISKYVVVNVFTKEYLTVKLSVDFYCKKCFDEKISKNI